MKYVKKTPRLTVKYINANTDEILAEIHDKTWMNVGELLSDYHVSEFMKKNNLITDELMIIVVGEYDLVE